MEARFAKGDLETEDTGFSFHRLKPASASRSATATRTPRRSTWSSAATGLFKLDDEIIEVETLDAIRVSPEVTRAFEAGDDGLEVIVFGPRRDGDGELDPSWTTDAGPRT